MDPINGIKSPEMKKIFLLYSFLVLLSCSKDDGIITAPIPTPDPAANVEVQDFMYRAMNTWYFWQADVLDLADNRFTDSASYTEFLISESSPGDFFDNKLLFTEDRFSFYADDYKTLTMALSGISKSNGLEFGLVQISGSNDVFGFVKYIIPGSDAATKDIARGELFSGVNGQTLTLANYSSLLFGAGSDSYTLNMATITNGAITASDKEVMLTKQEGLAENPVFLTKSFDIGDKKIGYLVYNGFTNEYDEDLNNAFGELKSLGVTDLVLDLRYNPGGSVNTARLLSSMIYGTKTTDVFLKARYNTKYQKYLEDKDVELREFFADKTGAGTPINTLNLNKVYILTTDGTASASELVINGLDPYVDIVQIGEATRGKNEFSVTMVDDSENDYVYNPQRVAKINPNNKWAIQPLIGRNENSVGFSDYTSGLQPTIELLEDYGNLGVLGDQNEPLLARAIQEITGTTAKRDFTVKMPIRELTNSKMFTPIKDNMFVDVPLGLDIQ